jgi:hypothetical protein
MTDHQWQQAYAAYKRVRGHRTEEEEGGSVSESAAVVPQSPANTLLRSIRQNTAYRQARQLVDRIFYFSLLFIVLFFLIAVFGTFVGLQFGVLLLALPQLAFSLAMAFLLRQLAHVVIDIPDIALQKASDREPEATLED